MSYNSRVDNPLTAVAIYGKDAIYHPLNHTYEFEGKTIVLGKNKAFTIDDAPRTTLDERDDPTVGRWDTNDDKMISLGEANSWYNYANGQPIEVDASMINVGYVSDVHKDGVLFQVSTLIKASNGTSLIFGVLDLTYIPAENGYRISKNKYDFDVGGRGHPWGSIKGFFRNLNTIAGNIWAGVGMSYDIYFKGVTQSGYNEVIKNTYKSSSYLFPRNFIPIF